MMYINSFVDQSYNIVHGSHCIAQDRRGVKQLASLTQLRKQKLYCLATKAIFETYIYKGK